MHNRPALNDISSNNSESAARQSNTPIHDLERIQSQRDNDNNEDQISNMDVLDTENYLVLQMNKQAIDRDFRD